jgi:hypothetical protein
VVAQNDSVLTSTPHALCTQGLFPALKDCLERHSLRRHAQASRSSTLGLRRVLGPARPMFSRSECPLYYSDLRRTRAIAGAARGSVHGPLDHGVAATWASTRRQSRGATGRHAPYSHQSPYLTANGCRPALTKEPAVRLLPSAAMGAGHPRPAPQQLVWVL